MSLLTKVAPEIDRPQKRASHGYEATREAAMANVRQELAAGIKSPACKRRGEGREYLVMIDPYCGATNSLLDDRNNPHLGVGD